VGDHEGLESESEGDFGDEAVEGVPDGDGSRGGSDEMSQDRSVRIPRELLSNIPAKIRHQGSFSGSRLAYDHQGLLGMSLNEIPEFPEEGIPPDEDRAVALDEAFVVVPLDDQGVAFHFLEGKLGK
jgi:hypothetical protein